MFAPKKPSAATITHWIASADVHTEELSKGERPTREGYIVFVNHDGTTSIRFA